MNKIILILIATLTVSAQAQDFSAFVYDDNLYVTLMLDTCNNHSAGLTLAPNCAAGTPGQAMTTDYVETCKAELSVRSTKMFCGNRESEAKALKVDLKGYNLRKTIKDLELTWGSSTVDVSLKNSPKFSAFINNGNLELTGLGDTCNAFGADLSVSKFCDKNRMTRNGVVSCDIKLGFIQTEIFCPDQEASARTASVVLKNTVIDPQAKTLVLEDYNNDVVEVDVK